MKEITAYSIYDTKAEVYDTPVFFLNEVTAKRWFYTLVQKGEGRFEFFTDEMELVQVCKFNVDWYDNRGAAEKNNRRKTNWKGDQKQCEP